jgi:hypothetical protein
MRLDHASDSSEVRAQIVSLLEVGRDPRPQSLHSRKVLS